MANTVTVAVVGGETREVTVGPDATYADLLDAVGFGPHEATALVDDRPVPEDDAVPDDADRVRVLRLVQGGGG
ncbi:MAG: ubiquitin-like small modifier protein 2 [Haloferacaceae archaeon]